ncbi:signal recognition particle protein Srp19 [ANME-1 cluster archaeon AG-394-G06]|nr:signal recognition particle protein Srp19 [ANME-1 cluster archaeon AG-394-G06]
MTEKIVIWPAYLAAGRTRKEGRKVSRKNAVKSPKVEEIEKVARILKLEPEVETEKAYPKTQWEKSGRVLVSKGDRKGVIMANIAIGIRAMREKTKAAKH